MIFACPHFSHFCLAINFYYLRLRDAWPRETSAKTFYNDIDFFPGEAYHVHMKIDIREITKTFAPKIRYVEVQGYFHLNHEQKIFNDAFYKKIEELTRQAYPSFKDKFDTKWEYFYLPMKRKGRLICTPIFITLYRSVYYVSFYGFSALGYLAVDKGDQELYEDYPLFIDEAMRFIPLLKETNNKIIERTFPYDLRRGKVQGKYIYEKEDLMPEEERNHIEMAYKKHLEKKLTVKEISLNDYFNTAAICYRAIYKEEKIKDFTPREMYQKFADRRHGGMLDIKDPDNKKEYMRWLNSDDWSGQHPFEIVYSFIHLGIHLFPPDKNQASYRLSVSNKLLTGPFVHMAVALVEHNVPFEAYRLQEGLDYLTGESFVDVNVIGFDTFHYEPSRENRKKYFPHIQWDPIEVVKWK